MVVRGGLLAENLDQLQLETSNRDLRSAGTSLTMYMPSAIGCAKELLVQLGLLTKAVRKAFETRYRAEVEHLKKEHHNVE